MGTKLTPELEIINGEHGVTITLAGSVIMEQNIHEPVAALEAATETAKACARALGIPIKYSQGG